jgi:hypothetical protein
LPVGSNLTPASTALQARTIMVSFHAHSNQSGIDQAKIDNNQSNANPPALLLHLNIQPRSFVVHDTVRVRAFDNEVWFPTLLILNC